MKASALCDTSAVMGKSEMKVQTFYNTVRSSSVSRSSRKAFPQMSRRQVAGSNLTAGHSQATLSKLLTYGLLRSTQPPALRRKGNELRATG